MLTKLAHFVLKVTICLLKFCLRKFCKYWYNNIIISWLISAIDAHRGRGVRHEKLGHKNAIKHKKGPPDFLTTPRTTYPPPPLKRVCIEGTFFNVMQILLAIAKSDFLEKCQLSYQHFLVLGTSWVIFLLLTWHVDCEHICTRVENPREGVAQIFAWGVKAFQAIFPRGSPISGNITFIFSKSFKNLPGGPILHPPFSLTPPVCVNVIFSNRPKIYKIIFFVFIPSDIIVSLNLTCIYSNFLF